MNENQLLILKIAAIALYAFVTGMAYAGRLKSSLDPQSDAGYPEELPFVFVAIFDLVAALLWPLWIPTISAKVLFLHFFGAAKK